MPDYLKIYEAHCPRCHKLHTSSKSADDGQRPPEPGDPSICNQCAAILVFTEDRQLAVPDRETLEVWSADPILWAAIDNAVKTVKTGPHYQPE